MEVGILRVKELMKERGISRSEMALRLGVAKTTVSNICSETHLPTIKLLLQIAVELDVCIKDLFHSTKNNSANQTTKEIKELLLSSLMKLEQLG